MNNTSIQITCVGREVNAKTLQALSTVLFPAIEQLEKELQEHNAMELDDQLVWDLQVEGPDWDYTATGNVIRVRNTKQLGSQKINFHTDRAYVGDNRRAKLESLVLAKVLATNLESQELLAL